MPSSADFGALVDQVVELTRSCCMENMGSAENITALYAHGSFVEGEMDEWSDVDICLFQILSLMKHRRMAMLRGR